jgi:hypothetical protein
MEVCVMQIFQRKIIDMKRDMDLIRDLLLHVESDPLYNGQSWVTPDIPSDVGVSDHSIEEISYHLTLLIEAGYLAGNTGIIMPTISKLTWKGHEFLDDIKDKDVWSKTKERIQGLSGIALSVVAEIAKAEIKKKLGLS